MGILRIVSKRSVAAFALILINLLFSLKYLERYTEYGIAATSVLLLGYLAIFYFRERLSRLRFNYGAMLVLLYTLFSVILFLKVDIHTLNVDRWSVIASFWERYIDGGYAYMAQSFDGNYPGPMPFYFILALPFYLIGELGCFSLLGMFLFWGACRYSGIGKRDWSFGLLFLCLSLFFLWEVMCRSNLFTNAALVLCGILFLMRSSLVGWRWIAAQGVLIGLLMSTRNVFAIPYIITFMYFLISGEQKFKTLFATAALALAIYGMTFLPFVCGHWEEFLRMNPFIIQGSFLMPLSYTLLFVALAFAFSFLCKTKADVIFYSGTNLFLTTLFYFIYRIVINGFETAYHGSSADISYFIFCTPFLLYYLIGKKICR